MKRYASALVAAFLAVGACGAVWAQAGVPDHGPDARSTQSSLIALYFGPKTNAPFTATAKTIAVRILPDGSTITNWNQRTVARDMDGRIFQERRTLVPQDSTQQPTVRVLEYTDPVAHTFYSCNPIAKVCTLNSYYSNSNFSQQSFPLLPEGLQRDGTTFLTRENLGVETFEGMEVQHSRETFTFYKETIGNTNTILHVVEYWYSPELGIDLKVTRHDPRDGDQTLWLTNISTTAADPSVFQIPQDYRILDRRPRLVTNPATGGGSQQ